MKKHSNLLSLTAIIAGISPLCISARWEEIPGIFDKKNYPTEAVLDHTIQIYDKNNIVGINNKGIIKKWNNAGKWTLYTKNTGKTPKINTKGGSYQIAFAPDGTLYALEELKFTQETKEKIRETLKKKAEEKNNDSEVYEKALKYILNPPKNKSIEAGYIEIALFVLDLKEDSVQFEQSIFICKNKELKLIYTFECKDSELLGIFAPSQEELLLLVNSKKEDNGLAIKKLNKNKLTTLIEKIPEPIQGISIKNLESIFIKGRRALGHWKNNKWNKIELNIPFKMAHQNLAIIDSQRLIITEKSKAKNSKNYYSLHIYNIKTEKIEKTLDPLENISQMIVDNNKNIWVLTSEWDKKSSRDTIKLFKWVDEK